MTGNLKQYEGLRFRLYGINPNPTIGIFYTECDGSKMHEYDRAFHLKLCSGLNTSIRLWKEGYYFTITNSDIYLKNIFYEMFTATGITIQFDWDYYAELFGEYKNLYLELFYGIEV
jgi:hypothetical protein